MYNYNIFIKINIKKKVSIEENFINIMTNNKKREKVNTGNKCDKLFIIKINRNKGVLNKP